MSKKAGFLTIVGIPNAGKSTLINLLVGEKVSIVSDKPQTTRRMTKGILTEGDSQFVFVDTPGFHVSKKLFNQLINKEIEDSLEACDITIFITDSSKDIEDNEKNILNKILSLNSKKVLIFNKIDLGINESKKEFLLKSVKVNWDKIFYTSLIKDFEVKSFLNDLKPFLKDVAQFYYDPDLLTDMNDKSFCEDVILEKIYHITYQEVPYSTYVEIIIFKETEEKIEIEANVCVERDSQKSILIGKGGEMIKKIRILSEKELSDIYGKKVKINLFVKVDKNWSKNKQVIKGLGYFNKI
ncbi:MAG: GTPase Era [Spirochaetes bacterium]|nr:GTPase Era [Spirochaetota bacterium]